MIARQGAEGRWVLTRQHDHGLISGVLADHWRHRHVPSSAARFAVAHHDVAWIGLDATVRARDDGRPYTFLDHPLAPKYHAYRAGVDLAEGAHPYAGWLCSRHYARFASALHDSLSARFVAAEATRRARLWALVPTELRADAPADVDLLVFCDNLSLFLCLNAPGENTWPWFRDGLRFGEETVTLRWRNPSHLVLNPFPFDGSFTVVLPTYGLAQHAGLAANPPLQLELAAPG